ncbi:MAG: alkylation response protein AidB-like acyl-CoA dehydrogenase [Porticoccaceae bacterium]|jgi:alkylation response protein AidB-like acyl-CoA dehydrogenase
METLVARAIALESLIRQYSDQADRERRLAPEVAEAFVSSGLYRLPAPKKFGGSEADPMTQVKAIEAVSRADGSAGWNLMIGIEHFAMIKPDFAWCEELIGDPSVVISGSTAATGRAERVQGGYRITGRWQFASGVHNSQLFAATVALYEDGEKLSFPPRVYALIKKGDYEIIDAWQVGGMRGSGSHDVVVDDVFVPDAHFIDHSAGTTSESPLARFPAAPRLSYNKAAVALGIGRHALDEFYVIALKKKPRFSASKMHTRPFVQDAVARAEIRLRASRGLVLELTETLWNRVCDKSPIPDDERALFHIACCDCAQACVEVVDLVCEAVGTTANELDSPLERISRDVRVIRQHITVAPQHIIDGGRVLLGLEPVEVMLRG